MFFKEWIYKIQKDIRDQIAMEAWKESYIFCKLIGVSMSGSIEKHDVGIDFTKSWGVALTCGVFTYAQSFILLWLIYLTVIR